MKKIPLLILALILLSSPVLAENLDIKKEDHGSTVLVGLNNPAKYTLTIKNNGETDMFQIYTLLSIDILPENKFEIKSGEEKTLDIELIPKGYILDNIRGEYTFEYQIKGDKTGITKKAITIKIIELKDLFEITPQPISPESDEVTIDIKNKEPIDIEDLTLEIDSKYFDVKKTLSISPKKTKTITVPLKKQNFQNLQAGQYDVNVDLSLEGEKADYLASFSYLEKEGLAVQRSSTGFIIRESTTTKTNTGNTQISVKINEKKNLLTRLFTTFSIKPESSEQSGFFVDYYWESDLSPGQALEVKTTTNYTFPFILIIIVIAIVIAIKLYLQTSLVVKKRVSFVRTKDDRFALRVKLNLKARKQLTDINLTDRIPHVAKLYEKFGVTPSHIDPKTRKISWHINSLNAGEQRVISYVIYSKIKVLGRFELPAAYATYKTPDKKSQDVYSNKTYFAAETSGED